MPFQTLPIARVTSISTTSKLFEVKAMRRKLCCYGVLITGYNGVVGAGYHGGGVMDTMVVE